MGEQLEDRIEAIEGRMRQEEILAKTVDLVPQSEGDRIRKWAEAAGGAGSVNFLGLHTGFIDARSCLVSMARMTILRGLNLAVAEGHGQEATTRWSWEAQPQPQRCLGLRVVCGNWRSRYKAAADNPERSW